MLRSFHFTLRALGSQARVASRQCGLGSSALERALLHIMENNKVGSSGEALVVPPAVFLTRHLSLQICTLPRFVLKADHEVCIFGVPSTRLSIGSGQQEVPVEGRGRGGEKEPPSPLRCCSTTASFPPQPQQLPPGLSLGFGSTVSSQGPLARSGNGIQHSCSLGTSLSLICFLSPDHTPNIAFPLKALFKLSGVKLILLLNSADTVALTWVVVVGTDERKSLQRRFRG